MRKPYKYKDNSHDERMTFECSVQQKEFLYKACRSLPVSMPLRPWALLILIKEAENILGITFNEWYNQKCKSQNS